MEEKILKDTLVNQLKNISKIYHSIAGKLKIVEKYFMMQRKNYVKEA